MDKKKQREIINAMLSQKLCETGCFMKQCCIERYDNIEYRWDYVRLNVDVLWDFVRMEVITLAGKFPTSGRVNWQEEYSYETEEEFCRAVQMLYNDFVSIVLPQTERMIEEQRKVKGFFGNQQTLQRLEQDMRMFEGECKEKNDEFRYQKIVDLIQKSYQIRKKRVKTEAEMREYLDLERLACVKFGEWIIKTQGGYWKAEYPHMGYNYLVIVHPTNERKMVDIEELFRKRCAKRGNNPAFSYRKDLEFWKSVK